MERAEVARKENLVILTMKCRDEYEAMLLYDQMTKDMLNGGIRLDLETKPSTASGPHL